MKNIWIIANWKSNKIIEEALEWVKKVGPEINPPENLKVVICPQFEALEEIKKTIEQNNWKMTVGSQDLSPFDPGAYTGEESATALSELVTLAILGHSERRQNFGETDELVAKKALEANKNHITPLVCVQGKDTPVPEVCKLIAYEPIFAIGSDHPDTPEDANEVAEFFRQKYGQDLEVLYGGSVSAENCKSFVAQENIFGLLIGHKSLDAQEFAQIVKNLS
jgi:triosephosphate isomerase (TIM)